jgi:hypothetical protein
MVKPQKTAEEDERVVILHSIFYFIFIFDGNDTPWVKPWQKRSAMV